MNKPMSLKINEFCEQLAALLNEAELPFYIIEPYVNNALEEVHAAAAKQRKIELEAYMKEMEEKENAEGIRSSQKVGAENDNRATGKRLREYS